MSDLALDRGLFLPGPFTDWYRERPFQVAFAVSVLVHALLIAFVPGLRSVQIEPPRVLNVEIVIPQEEPPAVQEKASAPRQVPQPQVVQRPEIARQPEFTPPVPEVRPIERPIVAPEPAVEAVVRPPEPEAVAPVQRAELSPPVPREVPLPQPTPEQRIEVPVESRPVPPVQSVTAPQLTRVEPRPELFPEPIAEVPAPAVLDTLARELTATYGRQISTQIKRQQKYPRLAQVRGWEGTAEVLLKIAADGQVRQIALGKSTGRDILDKEALDMVRRASPLPQAPQQLRGRELSVTVPIVFRLQDS